MTAATHSNNMGTGGTTSHAPGAGVFVISEVIDFSSQSNEADDVFQVLNIPADSVVLNAGIDVLTVDSAENSGTVKLYDGTVTYVAATEPTSAVNLAGADAVAEMFVRYSSADTLDIQVETGAINAKVRVWAIIASVVGGTTDQRATFTEV